MKKSLSILNLVTVFIFALVLVSCEPKVSETFEFDNADGNIKIAIKGKQSVSFDPWVMEVSVFVNDTEVTGGSLEAYISAPNKENIKVTWVDERSAIVTFIEKDGETKIFPVSL